MPKTETRRCPYCGKEPTNFKARRVRDKKTGESKFGGEYYQCDAKCGALTLGHHGYNLVDRGPVE